MMKNWYSLAMLGMETQQAMWLRFMALSAGGPKAQKEARRMLSEKLDAAAHANLRLMMGATPDSVVKGYRRRVRANIRRLSK